MDTRSVQQGAAPDFDPGRTHCGEAFGVVGRCRDGIREVSTDLSLGDVEGSDKLDITDMVAAKVEMHDPGNSTVAGRFPVKFDALDQRRCAVPDPDQCDSHFCQKKPPRPRRSVDQ